MRGLLRGILLISAALVGVFTVAIFVCKLMHVDLSGLSACEQCCEREFVKAKTKIKRHYTKLDLPV